MSIDRSTCSDASACGGDKARETKRSARVAGEGGWKPSDREGASLSASEHDSASLHYNPQWPTSQRWRSLQLSTKQRSRAVEGLGGVIDESAHRKRTRATRDASPVSYRPRSGVGQRSMGKHNHVIGRSEVSEGSIVARKRVKVRGAKGPHCKHATINREGVRLRANLSSTVKLTTGPGPKPVAGRSANYSILCDGSSTERRRTRGNFAFTPYLTAWKGVKSQRNDPDLDSLTVKFAGEPSTGNLYTRFDEGRGGLAEWAGPLVYSIALCGESLFLPHSRPWRLMLFASHLLSS